MREKLRWYSVILAVGAVLGCTQSTAGSDIRPGMWSGGYGNLDGDEPRWHTVILDVEVEDGRIRGEVGREFEDGKLDGRVEEDGIRLNLHHDGRKLRCEGLRLEDGALLGSCESGDGPVQLQLMHEEEPPESTMQELAGIYATETGGRILVRKSIHLILTDFETGAVRVLYAEGPDRFIAGERFAVPRPVEMRVQFERGADARLVLKDASGEVLRSASRCCPYEIEEFTFRNDDVELSGSLYLPPGEGSHPAVVYVHGSGRQTRTGAGTWPLFLADRGFAVLAYDKRGQGKSGGKYALPGGGHDNQPHMKRRSTDVAAAARALKERPDIDGSQVGLVGGSQAGWVMPMAAGHEEIAFTVSLSGGATELSIEGRFSNWAGENDSGGASIDELVERLRGYEPSDYDFRPHFRAQKAPGLWLYGGLDRSNPSTLCVEMIEQIAEENGNDFTIVWFPDGNHGLWEARVGGAAEFGTLTGMVPGLHSSVSDWLEEKGFGPRETSADADRE